MLGIVERDLRGHAASCRSEPLVNAALAAVQRTDRYDRVLVLDGAWRVNIGLLGRSGILICGRPVAQARDKRTDA